jgi:MFS family permease
MSIVFLTMLVSSAALGLPGAFLKPLSREFGWTTAQISSALALRFMLYGLIGPFAAILMERCGLRRIVCMALILVAGGVLLVTRMTALWQLIVLWGLVLGISSGLTALVLGATVANRWFERRRGLVLGLLTASSATVQLIFLPLASSLIAHYGWRVLGSRRTGVSFPSGSTSVPRTPGLWSGGSTARGRRLVAPKLF